MKMIFGGVYKRKGHDTHNDQHYYIYIPVAYKKKDGVIRYRMVDTYEAERHYGTAGAMEDRIKYLEQANCEYCRYNKTVEGDLYCTRKTLTKAPQNFCYVEVE